MSDNKKSIYLKDYIFKAYLEYTMAVVTDRAVPSVMDGLKPVQLRILYGMKDMGLTGTAKPVKSAKVVGDVLGGYHPHGDSSVYDALVRMAQPFSLRYPLIIGQGNFGSRDGDNAAAMRYTEAKLSPYADLLLDEVNKSTVNFVPNYDGTKKEPEILPSRLPHLLLNGSFGIAVGLATSILPHNLTEIADAALHLIENPNATDADILKIVKGPDFPDGGVLISPQEELFEAYSTGRGGLTIRAVYEKEILARGQWRLIFTELPYQVGVAKVLSEIEELSNPQPKDKKKGLSPLQIQQKASILSMIESATDDSTKTVPRLAITPASSKTNEKELLNFLFTNTSLQSRVSVNQNVLNLKGSPETQSILKILQEWLVFRRATLRRRLQGELDRCEARLHIILGRFIVILNMNEVVEIIKHAEDPKKALMEKYEMSEAQAEDILEMKLRQLNGLESLKLEKEKEQLEKEISRLNRLLSNKTAFDKELSKEITEDKAKYGDERRTKIEHMSKSEIAKIAVQPTLKVEAMDIVLSKNGWIKSYKTGVEPVFKTGDALKTKIAFQPDTLLFVISKKGRVYTLNPKDLVGVKGDGIPLATLCPAEQGDSLEYFMGVNSEQKILFATSSGYGFLCTAKNLVTKQKAGKQYVKDEEGTVLPPISVPDDMAGLLVVGSNGASFKAFEASELAFREGGGKGLQLFNCENLTDIRIIENSKESLKQEAQHQKVKSLPAKFISKRGKAL